MMQQVYEKRLMYKRVQSEPDYFLFCLTHVFLIIFHIFRRRLRDVSLHSVRCGSEFTSHVRIGGTNHWVPILP